MCGWSFLWITMYWHRINGAMKPSAGGCKNRMRFQKYFGLFRFREDVYKRQVKKSNAVRRTLSHELLQRGQREKQSVLQILLLRPVSYTHLPQFNILHRIERNILLWKYCKAE